MYCYWCSGVFSFCSISAWWTLPRLRVAEETRGGRKLDCTLYIQVRIQEFGQGGWRWTRILGTKILSKFRNKKFENRYKIWARRDKPLLPSPLNPPLCTYCLVHILCLKESFNKPRSRNITSWMFLDSCVFFLTQYLGLAVHFTFKLFQYT